ncbi:MAG TPA: HIRAN domain-containing protein [Gaiellaceae bacterium]
MRTVYRITGTNFRTEEDRQALRAAKVGDPVTLEREPKNPYDANAVRVWIAGRHVGFVPAAMARKGLAKHIDERGAPPVGEQTGNTMTGRLVVEGGQPSVEIEEVAG